MTWMTKTLTALAMAASVAMAAPAFAQGEGGMMLRDGSVMVVMPDGRMAMRPVTDQAMLDSMVQKGRQVSAGQVVLMRAGKLYLVEDSRMPDGKMLSEILMSAR